MKTKQSIIHTIIALAVPFALAEAQPGQTIAPQPAAEHDEHDDDHTVEKGPNGGQLVESKAGFAMEVTVDKDRKARIVFVDAQHKALPLAEQSITGIAGERSAPVKLVFAKGQAADVDVLISDAALPAGAHVPMLLVIKTRADAKATTERFELHLHETPIKK